MADLAIAEIKTLKWEGGYCNIAGDKGGETIFGMARNMHPDLKIWKILDTYKRAFENGFNKSNYKTLEKLCMGNGEFKECMSNFYKKQFWDKIKGNEIDNQNLANALYDFAVNSGVARAVKTIQEILGVSTDGILGNKTLREINSSNGDLLCNELCNKRVSFLRKIANNGSNAKFLNGWLNRVNDFYIDIKKDS